MSKPNVQRQVAIQQRINGNELCNLDSLAAQGMSTENPQQIESIACGKGNHLFVVGYNKIGGNANRARIRQIPLLSSGNKPITRRLNRSIKKSKVKIKKDNIKLKSIELERNRDIVEFLGKNNKHRPSLVIGFAAETENLNKNAFSKLNQKIKSDSRVYSLYL